MKKYCFNIYDRYGNPCFAVATEFATSSGSVGLFFRVINLRIPNVPPVCYVRYAINAPGTGSVYREYVYSAGPFLEPVSVRQFFPSWDLRKIRKEWRCLNGK